MPKRSGRRAPKREATPYDEYSTWDIRIAKFFFYGTILATIIFITGIWVTIGVDLIFQGQLEKILSLGYAAIVMVWAGMIVLHLFIIVLLYIAFRGGKVKILKILFKDRLVAKKYENFQALRILIAFLLTSVYIFLAAFFIFILPAVAFEVIGEAWIAWVLTFQIGHWIFWIGLIAYILIIIVFMAFVIWNHGVYWVLKKIKRIEEEDEIKEQIHVEKLQKSDDDTLHKEYNKETGKNAIYRGKETKGFIEWKEKKLG